MTTQNDTFQFVEWIGGPNDGDIERLTRPVENGSSFYQAEDEDGCKYRVAGVENGVMRAEYIHPQPAKDA